MAIESGDFVQKKYIVFSEIVCTLTSNPTNLEQGIYLCAL